MDWIDGQTQHISGTYTEFWQYAPDFDRDS